MWAALPATHRSWDGGLGWQTVVVWYLIAMQTVVEPGFYQRVFAARSPQTARRGVLISVGLWIVFDFLTTFSGLAARVFETLDTLLGRIPGRLSYLTVAGGATFSTLTGSTMANTAMLGSLMVPEMNRRGYAPHMSIGPIIGTGGLAMLIPPSSMGVLLGSLARIDIGALLIAGLLPGLILALLYCLVIWLQTKRDPQCAPAYESDPVPLSKKLFLVVINILPLGLVIFCVVGFILLGIATPSESAAFGALSVTALALANRALSLTVLQKSLASTVAVTAMVFLLVIASSVFGQLMAFSGASTAVVDWAISIDIGIQDGTLVKLLLMFGTLLLLGMFMDQISILLLTIPIFFPLAKALGFDPVWYTVMITLVTTMGAVTPPVGVNVYIVSGLAPDIHIGTIFKGVSIFLVAYVICLVLLLIFPEMALFLPRFLL